MLQAIHSKKYNSPLESKQTLNVEHSFDSNDKEHKIIEDTMVSSILGTLFLLPDNLIWQILDEATGHSLIQLYENENAPDIQNIEFWPRWDCSEIPEIKNEKYVEPDVVLHLPNNQIIIIEAKRDISNKQSAVQWHNEIFSAEHEGYDVMCLIALDGNETLSEAEEKSTKILKTTWQKLYSVVESYIKTVKNCNNQILSFLYDCKSTLRILNQTSVAFEIFGFFPMQYLNTLPEIRISDEATKFFANNKI